MKQRTLKTRLMTALQRRGFEVNHEAVSTKFVVMHKPNSLHNDKNYYLGASGALRYGRTIVDSVPAENTKKKLLKEVPE